MARNETVICEIDNVHINTFSEFFEYFYLPITPKVIVLAVWYVSRLIVYFNVSTLTYENILSFSGKTKYLCKHSNWWLLPNISN